MADESQGALLSAQQLAHWICDVARTCTSPAGLRVHSTKGIVLSTAFFRRVCGGGHLSGCVLVQYVHFCAGYDV